ncbi:hypothetical protein EG329_013647 [Mollisiaceae sp. DMI_Dod_QoI]|nr:hypothetical protein EG329_013647 [Helotiales sp. DMI_Dod_QoI]
MSSPSSPQPFMSAKEAPHPTTTATLQIESDLHLEKRPIEYTTYTLPTSASAQFLLLAGDFGAISHSLQYQSFLSRTALQYQHIFLIGGNNEFKGRDLIPSPSP